MINGRFSGAFMAAVALGGCAGPRGQSESVPAPVAPVVVALEGRAPGYSVAVAREGALVWSDGYGLADLATRDRARGQTRYAVFSVAKTWTVVALAKLAQSGRIDPGARIGDLAALENEVLADATLLELATHTSGVRHYADDEEARGSRFCAAVADALPIFADDPPAGRRGERLYSSWGFVLLSAAIEAAAQTSYTEHMREAVFARYGGTDVLAAAAGAPAPMYERGLDGGWRRAAADPSCKFGGGGFFASAEDVARIQSAAIADPGLAQDFKAMIFEPGPAGTYEAQGRSVGGASAASTDLESGWTVAVAMNADPGEVDLEALVRAAALALAAAEGP